MVRFELLWKRTNEGVEYVVVLWVSYFWQGGAVCWLSLFFDTQQAEDGRRSLVM